MPTHVATGLHVPHIDALVENTNDVETLLGIHSQLVGTGSGRKHNVEILNRSALVLLVACWEAFVEDMATLAFDHLLDQSSSPSGFPKKVLALASSALRTDNDETRVWELAGTGWRRALKNHRVRVLDRYVGKLHTPKPSQIDSLYHDLLGHKRLSSSWKWSGMPNSQAKSKLEALVTRRGEIAHRVSAGRKVRKKEVVDAGEFIRRLSERSSNTIRLHVGRVSGRAPWDEVKYH